MLYINIECQAVVKEEMQKMRPQQIWSSWTMQSYIPESLFLSVMFYFEQSNPTEC